MEHSKPKSSKVNLESHPFVEKVNPDPLAEPLTLFVGYLGPSKISGNVRVYSDAEFNSFYEIPTESIRNTSPIDSEDANSPTAVWVSSSARIESVQIVRETGDARIFSGRIQREQLEGATERQPEFIPPFSCTPRDPTGTTDRSVLCCSH